MVARKLSRENPVCRRNLECYDEQVTELIADVILAYPAPGLTRKAPHGSV